MKANSEIRLNAPAKGKSLRLSGPLDPGPDILVGSSPGVVETSFAGPRRVGLTIAFLVFGVFGLWSAFAPISGAVHGMGTVTVKSYKKLIQHLEGGIVKEILVQNGDHVEAGDVLLVIDSTQSLSQLEIINAQLHALMALEARLIAERDNLDAVVYPQELQQADVQAVLEMRGQDQVFLARKNSREGAIKVLEQRIGQLESRIVGLKAVQSSKSELAASYDEELVDVRALLQEGFADKLRLRELERNHALLRGEAADLGASIASAEIQIGETRLEILQLENEFQTDVVNRLTETQTQLKDARERVTALRDVVSRTEVRAPDAGVINGLQVHTIGGVISPGTPIAEIVPQTDDLVIEARVAPIDIDRVSEGQEAQVRMSAFSSKSLPTLYGSVLGISADALLDDATGTMYYLARVELSPQSIVALEGMELLPGMPAEVFITTPARTFLQYLWAPISNSFARSFRED